MRIVLNDNSLGEAVSFSKGILQVILPVAFAPGSPVLMRTASEPSFPLEGRVVIVQRTEQGQFDTKVRLINLRREHRQALDGFLSNAPSTAERTES